MPNRQESAGVFEPAAERHLTMRRRVRRGSVLGVLLFGSLVGLLAGCATPPESPTARAEWEEINDPLEPTNRYFFELNRFFDWLLLRPAADSYRRLVPDPVQVMIGHTLGNMGEPITMVNAFFQGRFDDGMTTFGRFAVNSTVGAAGLFDVATDMGLAEQHADFGQTLYTYGVKDGGPYLVLPLFGPSNPRDAIGLGVDAAMDPTGYIFSENDLRKVNYGRAFGAGVTGRADVIDALDTLERTSIDFYAQIRSVYRQHRAAQLSGAKLSEGDLYKGNIGVSPVPNYD